MRAIALRLEGVQQSWGLGTAGDGRPTADFPTKSGVLGLVASALGLERDAGSELRALHSGLRVVVRVDRPGVRSVDFHTAKEVPRAERGTAETVVTRREYLCDAAFTAWLVEKPPLKPPLEGILEALKWPRFAPFLGRRSCVPTAPLLARGEVLEVSSVLELLATIPVSSEEAVDVYVEGDLAEGPTASSLRRVRTLKVRDQYVGPLERQFGERLLAHVRVGGEDSVDAWFPK